MAPLPPYCEGLQTTVTKRKKTYTLECSIWGWLTPGPRKDPALWWADIVDKPQERKWEDSQAPVAIRRAQGPVMSSFPEGEVGGPTTW